MVAPRHSCLTRCRDVAQDTYPTVSVWARFHPEMLGMNIEFQRYQGTKVIPRRGQSVTQQCSWFSLPPMVPVHTWRSFTHQQAQRYIELKKQTCTQIQTPARALIPVRPPLSLNIPGVRCHYPA